MISLTTSSTTDPCFLAISIVKSIGDSQYHNAF